MQRRAQPEEGHFLATAPAPAAGAADPAPAALAAAFCCNLCLQSSSISLAAGQW